MHSVTQGVDDVRVLRNLPRQLQREAMQHVIVPLLTDAPAFSDLDPACLNALAAVMTPVHFSAGDVICEAKTRGSSVFFVQQGTIEYFKAGRWHIMPSVSCFGHECLAQGHYGFTFRAATHVVLY